MKSVPDKWMVVLLVATGMVYGNALLGDFQFDDFSTILENPHLDRWEAFVGHLDHMVRPVLHATYLLDRQLYGQAPRGYHVLNLMLHLGCGWLIYRIVGRAIQDRASWVPSCTAGLFLIHPMATETVTYISGRASGLMAFFYLLAFRLYLRSSEGRSPRSATALYTIGAVLSFMLALSSKETAMTFPLALLLWEVVVRQRRGVDLRRTILIGHLPFWLVGVVAGVVLVIHPRYAALAQFSMHLRPVWDNLLSQLHALVYSLLLYLFPWRLNFDHDLPLFHSLLQWPLALDLLVVGGLAAAAVTAARRFPLLSFGVGWFGLQVLPTSLIPRTDLLSERNLYLASFGLHLALVVVGAYLLRRLREIVRAPEFLVWGGRGLVLIVALTLGLLTSQRNALYGDQARLWADTVSKSPNKARAHNNLGHAYAVRGEWDRAIDEFRAAIALDPDYALAQENLRAAYLHHVGRL